MRIMDDYTMKGWNIGKGIKKTVERALEKEGFLENIFEILLGDNGAAEKAKQILIMCGNELTLNEMVAVNALYKYAFNREVIMEESMLGGVPEKAKRKLSMILGKIKGNYQFQNKIIANAIKDPKVLIAIGRVVVTKGGDTKADAIVARAIIKAYKEEKEEEQEQSMTSEQGLEEAFDPDTTKHVSLFVGRFQPFTLGHVKCVKKLRDEFGVPVLICAIPVTEEKSDKEHPFYGELQDKMYENLRDGLNGQFPGLIADVTYVPNAYIGNLVDTAKNLGFQPIGWGCGTDRYEIKTPRKRKKKETDSDYVISGYKPQTDKYIEQQRELDAETQNINPDNFNLLHIQRDVTGEGDDPVSKISGTKVREAIMSNDRDAFERMVPECLYGLFDGFKAALERIYGGESETQNTAPEPAYQTSGSLREDEEYFAYRKRLDEAITRLVTGKRKK